MKLEGKPCAGGPLCVSQWRGRSWNFPPARQFRARSVEGKNEFMGKFFEKSSENSREISKAGSLSSPSMGKTVKT